MRIIRDAAGGAAGLVTAEAAAGLVVEVLMFEVLVGEVKNGGERNQARRPRINSWACATPTMPSKGRCEALRFLVQRLTSSK